MKCVSIAILAVLQVVQCANILGITTLLSHSHGIWNEVLGVGLSEKGHNVTYLSHDPKKKGNENYTVILMEGVYEAARKVAVIEEIGVTFSVDDFWGYLEFTCHMDLQSEGLKTLLNYPKDYKFDLVIWDMMSGECLFPLIKRFGNPPIVGVSPYGIQPFVSEIMGNHIFNYVPSSYSYPSDRVNFWERLYNTFYNNFLLYRMHNNYLKSLRTAAQKVFGEDIEDFLEVERRISVALVNTDANFDFPQALPPNIIPVGGLQITPPKQLPGDLQKLLDQATNGVVYFSLGSNLRAEVIPVKNFFSTFSECFAKLPYTVLWKIDAEDRKYSNNVITKKWLPQSDVLAHPNVKVFISHGGALGTQEAMYHGVPLIGLPFFLDQINNIEKMVSRGLGKKLDLHSLSTENICETIVEVIENPGYQKRMNQLSARIKDQETTPLQRAIFWVEYVLRHGTGDHLSIAARDMSVIETLNLDIILLVIIVSLSPLFLLCLCCRSSKTKKLKQK